MIFADGPSDVGGASDAGSSGGWAFLIDVLPIGVALLALAVSAASFFMNSRKSARDSLWAYLQLVVSAETARARAVIGEAARTEAPEAQARLVHLANARRGSRALDTATREKWQSEVDAIRDAASQLLWVIALAGPAMGQRGGVGRMLEWRNTELYRAQVYEHLNLMIPELLVTMKVWGREFQSEESAKIADAALDSLPRVQKYGKGKSVSLVSMRLVELAPGGPDSTDSSGGAR